MRLTLVSVLISSIFSTFAFAGEADVVKVSKVKSGNGTWSFSVSVLHEDKGWDHFANKWEVLSLDGKVLGTRILAHPHENEQPFTRSQSGIKIPEGTKEVIVRTHDSVHGYGGKEVRVSLE